jgi:hypothetical protein
MQSKLNAILELTDQVQAAIDAGDWQRAQHLEAERRAQLERLVAEHATGADLPSALMALEQGNRRLIGLVEHHKRRVLREAATVRTSHACASAYEAAGATP